MNFFKKKNNSRDSNFELMRIVAMLYIIMWHIILKGNIWFNSPGVFFDLVVALISVHVNSFIILFGYFNYDKSPRLSKMIKLNNSIWFYMVIITIMSLSFGIVTISKLEILKNILPISFNDYWFLTCYMILYAMTPLLNSFIKHSNKYKYRTFLIVYFILLLLLPYMTNGEFYDVDKGYSIINFIFLYMLGAYFKKYPITENKIYKKISIKKTKQSLVLTYLSFSLINCLLLELGKSFISSSNGAIKYLGVILAQNFQNYNNPFVIIASVAFFLYFSLIKIKNKYINHIAKYVLGCYLITENPIIEKILYQRIGYTASNYNISIFPKVIIDTVVIFIICIIIEELRQVIFEKCSETKIAEKLRNKVKKMLRKYKLSINY